eukprot:GILJ01004932.1.p1 GENE.GILJ01004932.1~~GILJ01004932.1.p1  ORF type:complete len:694 (-),score=71.37 GILJ01004932.1:205-2286(-)
MSRHTQSTSSSTCFNKSDQQSSAGVPSLLQRDWAWVFRVLHQHNGVKFVFPMLDTVILDERRQLQAWLFTSKKGQILRKKAENMSVDNIRQKFVSSFRECVSQLPRQERVLTEAESFWLRFHNGKRKRCTDKEVLDWRLVERGVPYNSAEGLQPRLISSRGTDLVYHNSYKIEGDNRKPRTSSHLLIGEGYYLGVDSVQADFIAYESDNSDAENESPCSSALTRSSFLRSVLSNDSSLNQSFNSSIGPTMVSKNARLNEELDALTHRIVTFVEESAGVKVYEVVAEYTIDAQMKPWFTGFHRCLTTKARVSDSATEHIKLPNCVGRLDDDQTERIGSCFLSRRKRRNNAAYSGGFIGSSLRRSATSHSSRSLTTVSPPLPSLLERAETKRRQALLDSGVNRQLLKSQSTPTLKSRSQLTDEQSLRFGSVSHYCHGDFCHVTLNFPETLRRMDMKTKGADTKWIQVARDILSPEEIEKALDDEEFAVMLSKEQDEESFITIDSTTAAIQGSLFNPTKREIMYKSLLLARHETEFVKWITSSGTVSLFKANITPTVDLDKRMRDEETERHLGKAYPGLYYSLVSVCENCCRFYSFLDRLRAKERRYAALNSTFDSASKPSSSSATARSARLPPLLSSKKTTSGEAGDDSSFTRSRRTSSLDTPNGSVSLTSELDVSAIIPERDPVTEWDGTECYL